MNRLRQYLRDEKTSATAFAKKIGFSKSYLSEVLNGRQKASLDLAVAIEQATDKAVTCVDVFALKNSPAEKGADRIGSPPP